MKVRKVPERERKKRPGTKSPRSAISVFVRMPKASLRPYVLHPCCSSKFPLRSRSPSPRSPSLRSHPTKSLSRENRPPRSLRRRNPPAASRRCRLVPAGHRRSSAIHQRIHQRRMATPSIPVSSGPVAEPIMRPEVVLLDIDGTLVDSNDAHALAWVDALTEAGHRVTFEQVRSLIGKGGDKLLPEVTGIAKDSSEGKKLSERRSHIFKKRYLPQLRPFPKASALLERLHQDGLRLVAATSAQEDEMDALLKITEAPHLFFRATSSSDAPRSKPDPDIIEAALEKAGRPARQTIMLGDTPYDVDAATKAGVRVVALRSGGWQDDDLRGAVAIYDDAADLLSQYDESPFGTAK
jgi:HAD superfamily hydrolase (TIGR01509 family)